MSERLIPYRNKAMWMLFRNGVHVADVPYALVQPATRVYTMADGLAGVSHPGADPNPSDDYATHLVAGQALREIDRP